MKYEKQIKKKINLNIKTKQNIKINEINKRNA